MTTHEGEYQHPAAADPGQPVDLSPLLADAPPRGQEGRVVATLRARGEFARPGRRWGRAAASLALFAAGAAAGAIGQAVRTRHAPAESASLEASGPEATPAWALVLLDGPDYKEAGSRAEEDRRVAALARWAGKLADSGRLVLAEELGPVARTLPVGTSDAAGFAGLGIFVIHAADVDDAVAVASGSPHLVHGGRMAVHPIVPH